MAIERDNPDELFRIFSKADDFHDVREAYNTLCSSLDITPSQEGSYDVIKSCVHVEEAKTLFCLLDKRAKQSPYQHQPCKGKRVFVIGGGPCGLRSAIEVCLLGGRVTVVEMRDYITRNNVLHLWPFVIQDLKSIGAKVFYPKFCTGSLDHISIRRLQLILLKVSLIVGAEIYAPVAFEDLVPPRHNNQGWRAKVKPHNHPVNQVEFDFIIGADGKRNTLPGFERKCFRGKPALGITSNFVNYQTRGDSLVPEIGGIFCVYFQDFFNSMKEELGIDLENFVYYKNETHYFVMTAKKKCLIDRGVIKEDRSDMRDLLHPDNIDRRQLERFAYDAARFATKGKMPRMDFAQDHNGENDVSLFDFTAFYQAINSCRVMTSQDTPLLTQIVGDTLIEPFWPTGSGMARGFLSVFDAIWAIRNWCLGEMTHTEIVLQREKVFQCLSQTKPDTLKPHITKYTIDPSTRYTAQLWNKELKTDQVQHLFDMIEKPKKTPAMVEETSAHHSRKRKFRNTSTDTQILLGWFQRQLAPLNVQVNNLSTDWRNGLALCALLQIYRPGIVDISDLDSTDAIKNNALAFRSFEEEFGVSPMLSPGDMVNPGGPDRLTLLSYLTQLQATLQQQATSQEEAQAPHYKRQPSAIGLLNQVMMKKSQMDKGAVKMRRQKETATEEHTAKELLPSIKGIIEKRKSALQQKMLQLSDTDSPLPTHHSPPVQTHQNAPKCTETHYLVNEKAGIINGHASTSSAITESREWKSESPPKNIMATSPIHVPPSRFSLNIKTQPTESVKTSENTEENKRRNSQRSNTGVTLRQKDTECKPRDTDLQRGSKRMSVMEMKEMMEMKHLQEKEDSEKVEKQLKGHSKPVAQSSSVCCICRNTLYAVEKNTAFGYFFHRNCFRCHNCNCTLRLDSAIVKHGPDSDRVYFLCFRHGYKEGMFFATPVSKDPLKPDDSEDQQMHLVEKSQDEQQSSVHASVIVEQQAQTDDQKTRQLLQNMDNSVYDQHQHEVNQKLPRSQQQFSSAEQPHYAQSQDHKAKIGDQRGSLTKEDVPVTTVQPQMDNELKSESEEWQLAESQTCQQQQQDSPTHLQQMKPEISHLYKKENQQTEPEEQWHSTEWQIFEQQQQESPPNLQQLEPEMPHMSRNNDKQDLLKNEDQLANTHVAQMNYEFKTEQEQWQSTDWQIFEQQQQESPANLQQLKPEMSNSENQQDLLMNEDLLENTYPMGNETEPGKWQLAESHTFKQQQQESLAHPQQQEPDMSYLYNKDSVIKSSTAVIVFKTTDSTSSVESFDKAVDVNEDERNDNKGFPGDLIDFNILEPLEPRQNSNEQELPQSHEQEKLEKIFRTVTTDDGSSEEYQTASSDDDTADVAAAAAVVMRKQPKRNTLHRLSKSLRLILAHEIQQGLEHVDEESEQLETRGIEVEKALRRLESREDLQDDNAEDDNLLAEWLEVLCRKQALKNEEAKLLLQARLMELQHEQRHLQSKMEHMERDDIEDALERLDAAEEEVKQKLKDTEDQMKELQLGLETLRTESDT